MVFLVALSLSMDAFSLAIAYGLANSNFNYLHESIIIGIFHFIMPLLGYILGNFILAYIALKINILVGIILIIISINIIIESTKNVEVKNINNIWQMFLLALAVSLDSFSLGIGLKALIDNIIVAPFVFSFVSFLITYLGFIFGKFIGNKIGNISKIISSIILLLFGIYYLFK